MNDSLCQFGGRHLNHLSFWFIRAFYKSGVRGRPIKTFMGFRFPTSNCPSTLGCLTHIKLRVASPSPQSNCIAESFVKTFKRDYVAFGDLSDARTVMAQLPKWFEHYYEVHPHSALKYLSPRMFRRGI